MNYKIILKYGLLILILIELVLSIYLIVEGNKDPLQLCISGDNCDLVQSSQYNNFFGMKLTIFSLISFVILGVVLFLHKRLFFILASIGALFSLYFIAIQLFILKAICSMCIVIDSIMILIFILSLFYVFKKFKN